MHLVSRSLLRRFCLRFCSCFGIQIKRAVSRLGRLGSRSGRGHLRAVFYRMIIPPLIVCSDKKRQINGNGTPFYTVLQLRQASDKESG
jgi:hypothetical protein